MSLPKLLIRILPLPTYEDFQQLLREKNTIYGSNPGEHRDREWDRIGQEIDNTILRFQGRPNELAAVLGQTGGPYDLTLLQHLCHVLNSRHIHPVFQVLLENPALAVEVLFRTDDTGKATLHGI